VRGSQPLRLIGVRAGVAAFAVLVALALAPAVSSAAQKVIESPGSPLSSIFIDEDLGCQVQAAGDIEPSFFGSTEPGACGTFLALTEGEEVAGGTHTFGSSPPAGITPEQDFEAVGPQTLAGSGTAASPFVITTEAGAREPEAEGTGSDVAKVTEIDRYVAGRDSYETTITVLNNGEAALKGTLYHAGDCVLSSSDAGFGAVGVPSGGAVACTSTADDSPAGRFMAFAPTSGPTPSFIEGPFSSVWSNVNSEATPFPDTFDATTFEDNGMGLSWPISLVGKSPTGTPGGSATVTFTTTITPFEAAPPPPCTTPLPTVSITSDQGHSSYAIGDSASVTVAASGIGLTSDPSAAHVPISTATPGTFAVTRSATGPCGTASASFTYTVIPPPVLGKTVNVNVVSGKVFVAVASTANASLASNPGDATESLSKGLKFVPLQEARQIPVGSILNTSAGVARVTTATASKGKLQFGDFGAGIFKLLQRRQQRGLTELDVMNAHSARQVCATLGKSAVEAKHLSSKVLGRITGSAHGRFTTRGQFSAATVRGTVWGVRNRCDGTLTRVTRGVVSVRDFTRRKTLTLVTGQSYLARASAH
jgi:hypothetical protein